MGDDRRAIYTDQYYNLRLPEKTPKRSDNELIPCWYRVPAPLDRPGPRPVALVRGPAAPRAEGRRRLAGEEMTDPDSKLWRHSRHRPCPRLLHRHGGGAGHPGEGRGRSQEPVPPDKHLLEGRPTTSGRATPPSSPG